MTRALLFSLIAFCASPSAIAQNIATSTAAAIAAPPSGVDLALTLLDELHDGTLSRSSARERFLALPIEERDRFLEEWKRISDPRERELEIYSDLRARRNLKTKAEPTAQRPRTSSRSDRYGRRSYDDSARHDQQKRALEILVKQKSTAGAWALSFFLGLGSGNFYAGSPGYGALVLAGELVGAIMAFAGKSTGVIVAGVVLNRAAWVADWAGAISNTQEYNERLLTQASRSAPPGFVFAFEF